MLNKRPIIMVVDTGVDDTLALLLVAAADSLDLKAITTVFGNCSVADTTKNTLKICELYGLDVPVAAGAYRPLIDPPIDYSVAPMVDIHGRDGLGNVGNTLPEPTKQAETMVAADLMAKAVKESEGKVTIVATAPLTNIATFLMAYPDLHEKVECIALMGGAAFGGNLGFSVEANIGHDPDAAKIVFMSDIPKYMFSLDATMSCFINDAERQALADNGGKTGEFLQACLQQYSDIYKALGGLPGAVLHDSLPVAWLLDPTVVEFAHCHVDIELKGTKTRGCTVTDLNGYTQNPANTYITMKADREKLINMHIEAVKKFK